MWRMSFNPARKHIESAILTPRADHREVHVRAICDLVLTAPLEELGGRGTPVMDMLHGLWRIRNDANALPADILQKSGMSRTHSYRLFQWIYGMGPGRALDVTRLDLARWLLFKGHRVGDIAAWCGFPTRHAFMKRWVAQFGGPPRAFRHVLAELPRDGYANNHLKR
jgi:AraC-like DNA-binding protein